MKELKPIAGVTGPLGVSRKNQKVGDMQTTLNGKQYTFEQRAVLYTDLVPDTTNPRYAMLVNNGPVTDEEMLAKLKSEAQHKFLRESIKENEGLIEPIFVREEKDGNKRVYEGNRRWAALNDLYEEDKITYKYVPAYYIPEDMSQEAWLKYLGILHEQGKADWVGYSRAVYIRKMREAGIPVTEIAAFTGRSKSDVERAIKTSEMVEEYVVHSKGKDEQPESRYAQLWEVAPMELAQNKKGRKAAYHVLMTGQIKSAKHIRVLRSIHRDDPASFAKLSVGEITLDQAAGKAGQVDEVGGSTKRFKTMVGIITKKYPETKATLVKNPDAMKEARKLFKLLDGLIVAANDEIEIAAAPATEDDE